MIKLLRITRAAAGTTILLLMSASNASTQQVTKSAQRADDTGSTQASVGRVAYLKAFVINDRLSALRREPSVQSEVIRRLRLGRTVFIVSTSKPRADQRKFCRVAVTRRTRGWIHESALAVQSLAGEDLRIMKLIEATSDSVDRIALCRLLIDRFSQSRLVPRAMLLLGEEAERVTETLSQRTRRRLGEVRGADASVRDYYLSDAGLDRYSRLGIVFDFNESTGEFLYDGKVYRDLVRRFPESEEARLARQRLDLASRKTARKR